MQIHFENVTFAQSAKYVMIVKTTNETKRSEVCTLWTSVPTFQQPVLVDTLKDLTIKACSATIDRKLSVLGSCSISPSEIDEDAQVMFQGLKNILQIVEDREVCIGNCRIRILRKRAVAKHESHQEIDEDFELMSDQSESSDEEEEDEDKNLCELRFLIHGGFDFYLGSGFKVCVNWGKKKAQTKMVSNRITPFWGKNIALRGRQEKIVEISVVDSKGSKLEWMKLDPKQIRIMYPYHLHIKFREEYVGLHPHFYVTIIREDVPRFSILDKKINMKIKYVGPAAPQRVHQYLLICTGQIKTSQANQTNKLPMFLDLEMRNYISFDSINKTIQKNPERKYEWSNWNLLVPINLSPDQNSREQISMLKSFLTKSLVCLYFSLDDAKGFFCQQIWSHVAVVDRKEYFENCIKEIYYQEKRIVLGKSVEISNSDAELENEKGAVSLEEKWKILTHNYSLRKSMLSKSIEVTEASKKQIQRKGEELEQLKKILIEVKKMNEIMVAKQKSSLIEGRNTNKKIRQNYMKFSTIEIISLLMQKQVELQKRKKINDQMRVRMESLHYFNEDSEQLDKVIVENAEKLLEQQIKMKQLQKIKEALPKQREVILKLQRIFEKREIDRSMNELLQKNQDKLHQLKKAGSKNLEKVYEIVKQHKNSPNSLMESVKAAESELISLNAKYAKLTTMTP